MSRATASVSQRAGSGDLGAMAPPALRLPGGVRTGRAGPDEPLQPAPPPILSPRAQNHPRLPDGGAPRSAKDAMVSRGFPENVRQKALRGVSRGSDGRFHVSIRINPQKQAYIGSSEDVCVAARMRDVAEVLLFGPAADTAFDERGYDLEAVLRLEWLSIGDFSSREAGIRDIAQMADHQGELARAERRAAREQGPLLPGMAAGDAFSMRDYVRECSRDFTLETHPFFFMEGVARQPPKRGRRFSKTPWRRRRLPKPSRPPRRPMARPRRGRCGRRRRRRSQASPSTSQRGRGVRTTGGLWGSRWGCRRRRTLSEALSSRCRTPLPPSARPCGTTGRPRPAGRPGRKSIPPPPPRPPGSRERGWIRRSRPPVADPWSLSACGPRRARASIATPVETLSTTSVHSPGTASTRAAGRRRSNGRATFVTGSSAARVTSPSTGRKGP